MSPEQVQGIDVDHRSDIWSVGVVIYQMLTGQLPFKGDYEQAIMYAIINDEPEQLTNYRSGLPENLQVIINKTLEKNPEERCQNIEEVLSEKTIFSSEHSRVRANRFLLKKGLKEITRKPLFYIPISLSIILIMSFFIFKDLLLENQPIRIVMAPFEFKEGMSDDDKNKLDGLWIDTINELGKLEQIRPVDRNTVKKVLGTEHNIQDLKKIFHSDIILRTSVERLIDEYQFTLFIVNLTDNTEQGGDRFQTDLIEFRAKYTTQLYSQLGLLHYDSSLLGTWHDLKVLHYYLIPFRLLVGIVFLQ